MLDTARLTEKQRLIISLLQQNLQVPSLKILCEERGLDFNFVKGFCLSRTLDEYIQVKEIVKSSFVLTQKGKDLGTLIPGDILTEKLIQGITDVSQLQNELGVDFSTNYGALRKYKAVDIRENEDSKDIQVINYEILQEFQKRQATFRSVIDGQQIDNNPYLDWLVKQSFVSNKLIKDYELSINPNIKDIVIKSVVTTLNSDLIISHKWKDVELKPYNIYDDVPDIIYGRPSVLSLCVQKIRAIFLNMGFNEMAGQIVESSFWNFDVLFTAQDHPDREIQDTFYLANPQTLPMPNDANFIQMVSSVHESSYGGIWTEKEARKAILRTHTTASTVRNLYEMSGQDCKYFSVDKVFRNETVDKTHLAEFHQIEGVVLASDLSVRSLIGYLSHFYKELGFQDLKFKPTYNPYTEPSLEVYAYHVPSSTYLEVGNSGLFRPEVLEPLGCKGKLAVAWGLGLERIAMLLHDIEKISDMVGPSIALNAY